MDAILNGIAAIVEGFLQLVLLLFKSLFRLCRAGDSRLAAPDRQRHLTAGLLGLTFVFVVIVAVGVFFWFPF